MVSSNIYLLHIILGYILDFMLNNLYIYKLFKSIGVIDIWSNSLFKISICSKIIEILSFIKDISLDKLEVIVLISEIISSVFCSDLLISVLTLLIVWENSFFIVFKLTVFKSTILVNLEILCLFHLNL